MKSVINSLNNIRSFAMQLWLIVSHLVIYTYEAAKTTLWVGTLGWVVLVWNISGSIQFSWIDLKVVAIIVIALSVFMAIVRIIGVIILVIRAHRLTAAGKEQEARALDYQLQRDLYNVWGFTFHHNTTK
jgi:hypothetical protein